MVIGRVYKIISSQGNEVYVVNTLNTTRNKFSEHKRDYNKWKNYKHGKCKLFEMFV